MTSCIQTLKSMFFLTLLACSPVACQTLSLIASTMECAGAPGVCGGERARHAAYDCSEGQGQVDRDTMVDSAHQVSAIVSAKVSDNYLSEGRSISSVLAQYHDATQLQRIQLHRAPDWSHSAAWNITETALMMAGIREKSLFRYEIAEGLVIETSSSDLSTGRPSQPKMVQRIRDGHIIKNSGKEFVRVNEIYKVRNRIDLSGAGDASKGFISSVISWVATEEDLIILGDMETAQGSGSFFSAVIRVPMHAINSFSVLHVMDLDSNTRNYARLGYPVIAVIGDSVFMYKLDGWPEVLRLENDGQSRSLNIPVDGLSIPDFPREIVDAGAYSLLENASMPAALYAHGNSLFLLLHKAIAGAGRPEWLLMQIDPSDEAVISMMQLPVSSAHIMLIPGDARWAIVEKSQIESLGSQEMQAITLVPASMVTDGRYPVPSLGAGQPWPMLKDGATSHNSRNPANGTFVCSLLPTERAVALMDRGRRLWGRR